MKLKSRIHAHTARAKRATRVMINVSTAKLSEVHDGLTVADMPGCSPMDKAMNFSLFKRGALTREQVTASPAKRRVMRSNSLWKRLRGKKAIQIKPEEL